MLELGRRRAHSSWWSIVEGGCGGGCGVVAICLQRFGSAQNLPNNVSCGRRGGSGPPIWCLWKAGNTARCAKSGWQQSDEQMQAGHLGAVGAIRRAASSSSSSSSSSLSGVAQNADRRRLPDRTVLSHLGAVADVSLSSKTSTSFVQDTRPSRPSLNHNLVDGYRRPVWVGDARRVACSLAVARCPLLPWIGVGVRTDEPGMDRHYFSAFVK